MFHNLFFEKGFRDYNYNDFFDDGDGFGRLETVTNEWLEYTLRECFKTTSKFGPEPYFSRTLPTTLSPKACEGYLRLSNLPIDRRDYYLSKLFQFFYLLLDAKFEIGFRDRDISLRLRQMLDGIPSELLPPYSRTDWSELWWDSYVQTASEELDAVMSWLEEEIANRIRLVQSGAAEHTRAHKRGPQPQLSVHRKTARAVQLFSKIDWQHIDNLKAVCQALDRDKVPISPKWQQWKSPPRTWVEALSRTELVVKVIQYRIEQDRKHTTD